MVMGTDLASRGGGLEWDQWLWGYGETEFMCWGMATNSYFHAELEVEPVWNGFNVFA